MIQKAIRRAYKLLKERNWDTIYWAIDLHGTCIESNYISGKYEWINEDAKKCLQLIQSLPESQIIIWSSCYPEEYDKIFDFFVEHDITTYLYNCNPEVQNTKTGCFDIKFYFSILLDDKAGFDPETDWKIVLQTLKEINNECKRS